MKQKINFALMTVIEGERTWMVQPQTPAMFQDCDGNIAQARQKHICQRHRQQELLSPCSTTVCMDCAIKDHRNHDLTFCRTWQGSTGMTSASWQTTCRLCRPLSNKPSSASWWRKLLDLEAAKQRTTVKQHFAHLIKVLRAWEQQLMSEIEQMQAHKHKLLFRDVPARGSQVGIRLGGPARKRTKSRHRCHYFYFPSLLPHSVPLSLPPFLPPFLPPSLALSGSPQKKKRRKSRYSKCSFYLLY